MAETIETGCDGTEKWHWYNVQSDLLLYEKLDNELLGIDPLSVSAHGCGGTYDGTSFYMTWVKDTFLLLTMDKMMPELVSAFAAVIEYDPFVLYELNQMVTVEWDRGNPDARLSAIRDLDGVANICSM